MAESLSAQLHSRTKDVHDASDKLINVKLMVALTDVQVYGTVLKDFFHVYRAIEDGLDQCRDDPRIFGLRDPRWFRAAQLEQDVAFFLGPKYDAEPSPAAKKYLDRISYVVSTDPLLLVAYAHSMFLASLAGGQILGAIVKRTLGLSTDEGLAFFDYGDVNSKSLRSEFKTKIDEIEINDKDKDRLIEEKKLVFRMNNEIASQVKLSWNGFSRIMKLVLLFILVVLTLAFCLKCLL